MILPAVERSSDTALARFAQHLPALDEGTLKTLAVIAEKRDAGERELYLAAWHQARRAYARARLSPGEAAIITAINEACPSLAERSCGDAADRRVPMLAIGVARALLLRRAIGEEVFLTLTTEWRRAAGANSLR